MVEEVHEKRFFHINSTPDYSPYKHLKWEPNQKFHIGNEFNPFFGFYERARTYDTKNHVTGEIYPVPAIKFLSQVKNGGINCPNLPTVAHQIGNHFLMLTRETIWEMVRKEEFPEHPSRQKCLWLVEKMDEARYWLQRMEPKHNAQIVEVVVDGKVHIADGSLLIGDSEPYSTYLKKAKAYWQGFSSDNPEKEILFEGDLKVIASHLQ